jgi:site-specific DNA recombinase
MSEPRIGLIYIRQSRHKDSERTVSPEVQEAACRALPAIQRCDPVEVYVDLDKSGKSIAKRPDFQRFLDRIVTDPPTVIAVYDQSRSFRNTTEALDFYALMERMPHVTVALHLGHFERSLVGEFSYTALAAADTMERKMTGAKISEAKRYAAGKGEMVGAVPAGYRWEGTGRDRQLVIDEETAPVVRRIFDEYATGHYSTREIARRLNAEGVRLPRFTGGWRQDTVAQILGNVSYIGMSTAPRRRASLSAGNGPSSSTGRPGPTYSACSTGTTARAVESRPGKSVPTSSRAFSAASSAAAACIVTP